MNLQPVKHYKTVRYPDKYRVDLNKLLLSHKPKRWQSSSAALLLLCSLMATQLAGCKIIEQGPGEQGQNTQSTVRKMNMAPIFGETTVAKSMMVKKIKAAVVPLGNYPGIDMFDPLTEESALAIIKDELKAKGYSTESSNKKVEISKDSSSETWSFDLDIIGAKEPVYIEFIPSIVVETENELSERMFLALPDSPIGAAYALRESLCEVSDESTGAIFYGNELYLNQEANLRMQVSEFVEWLKTSGLI